MNSYSPFFYLAEKITAENLFEGFDVDLKSTLDLVKTLSEYNPTVWNYVITITKNVMQPIGVVLLAVLLVLEFSNSARKLANSGGAFTAEAFAPMIVKYIMVTAVITNTTVIVEAILAVGSYTIQQISGIVASGGVSYDAVSALKGSGGVGRVVVAFISLLIWLARLTSVIIVNVLITIRFMQLYLMIPFSPLTIPTFLSDDWRSVGIGYFKNVIVYSIQGVLIFLVVSLTPLFTNASNIAFVKSSGWGWVPILVGSVTQAILLIIVLIGTQRTARSIMGM